MKATDALDIAPKAVAVLSFGVLIVTVLHDWGYFWMIGLRFQSVQTPYDHLANSIEWLPYSLVFIGLTFAANSGLIRLLQKEGDFQEYPSGVSERNAKRKMKWPSRLFLFFNVVPAIITLFVLPTNAEVVVGLASVLYICAVWFVLHYTSLVRRTEYATFLAISPTFVTLAFLSGATEADIALNSTLNVYRVEVKGSTPVTLILLRSLDKGVLVWDRADNRATLIRWEQIDRISHFVSTDLSSRPLFCKFAKTLCFEKEPPTP
jgi:hypothetical protein